MPALKSSVAKDVFAYLLTFVMLYIAVVSFIALLWQIINVQLPDPARFYYQGSYDAMRNAIASLIVVWPVFLLMSRYLHRDMRQNPEKADIWVRRWLTYLTLFVAAMTMIVDLITLINSFLSGELSLSFALKVVVILCVAGAVFGYEFWDLKRAPESGQRKLNWLFGGSIAVLLAGIVAGFYFVGSPATARDIRLDNQRVGDLQVIQSRLIDEWNRTDALPQSLENLEDPLSGYALPNDPITTLGYEYKKTSDLSFELCATFARETPKGESQRAQYDYPGMYDGYGQPLENWTHTAGRNCFERTIDPVKHKYPKP